MNRMTKLTCLMCLVLSLVATRAFSHDDPKKAEAAPSEADMMKKMMEMAEPGPVHKTIGMMAGEWKVENKMMMPGAPEMTSHGTCSNKMEHGGRLLVSHFKGDMMGTPFEGRGQLGYDNQKKKPVCTWTDSMSTGIMYSEGECDAYGKVMTFKTEVDDPTTGGKCPVRFVYTVVDADKHTFDWYETREGKESKTMMITYTRAK